MTRHRYPDEIAPRTDSLRRPQPRSQLGDNPWFGGWLIPQDLKAAIAHLSDWARNWNRHC